MCVCVCVCVYYRPSHVVFNAPASIAKLRISGTGEEELIWSWTVCTKIGLFEENLKNDS